MGRMILQNVDEMFYNSGRSSRKNLCGMITPKERVVQDAKCERDPSLEELEKKFGNLNLGENGNKRRKMPQEKPCGHDTARGSRRRKRSRGRASVTFPAATKPPE
ncbi:unnamed protein product [Cochlearia groenlandica]